MVEVLITMTIIGVVAGLMIPVISSQVERSRAQEAIQHLDTVKDALRMYYSLNRTYSGASFSNIKYDPNQPEAGQGLFFSYSLSNLTNANYTITAQREPAAANAGNTITLDETGNLIKNGAYA